jgi:ABC-type Fe3+ transport system substrate-binding protein
MGHRSGWLVTDVLVYATSSRAQTARALLQAGCLATGINARLELYGSGSLYQRLGPRHAPPLPDVVLWFGPFAAQSAGLDGLLQPYQPASVSPTAVHDPNWRWTTLDYLPIGIVGPTGPHSLQDVAAMPLVSIADPERSEVGLSVVLATLDRARQVEGDPERAWTWWQQRAASGLVLAEEDAAAVGLVADGSASHALSLFGASSSAVAGLAPIPNVVSLAASARSVDAAKHLVDWLTSDAAADALNFSPWRAATNGLQALLEAAPALDVEWCRKQYTATRQRWARSGFGPQLRG